MLVLGEALAIRRPAVAASEVWDTRLLPPLWKSLQRDPHQLDEVVKVVQAHQAHWPVDVAAGD